MVIDMEGGAAKKEKKKKKKHKDHLLQHREKAHPEKLKSEYSMVTWVYNLQEY